LNARWWAKKRKYRGLFKPHNRRCKWRCNLHRNEQMQGLLVYDLENSDWLLWVVFVAIFFCETKFFLKNLTCYYSRRYTNICSQSRKMCDRWIILGDIVGVSVWHKRCFLQIKFYGNSCDFLVLAKKFLD
jgi:hypothetical protein